MARGPHDRGAPARFSEEAGMGAKMPAAAGRALDPETAARDARIGALLRKVPPPLPLLPARRDRVALRLAGQVGTAPRGRRRWAFLALLIAGTSSLVFAAEALRSRLRVPPPAAALSEPETRPLTPPPEARTARLTPAVAAPLLLPPTSPPPAAPQPPVRRGSRALAALPAREPRRPPGARKAARLAIAAPTRSPAAPASTALVPPSAGPVATHAANAARLAPPDTTNIAELIRQPVAPAAGARPPYARLGEETALLRRALESLRHDDDAAGALDALDDYERRFPFGVLRPNAQLVRIDALVALGRKAEALTLLEAVDLSTSPRADDLLITRGELRARQDCRAASADFTSALARTPDDARAERALRGRALCARRLGDDRGMRADLEAYLTRFPRAAFAARARALLDR